MSKWVALVLYVVALAVGSDPGRCLAQGAGGGRRAGPTRFQPSRPTISPYMNLFRRDTGPIPNYHLYVRPIQRQQALNQQQQLLNVEQGMALQELQLGLNQVQRSATGSTGIGAGFRNFSHFYNGLR